MNGQVQPSRQQQSIHIAYQATLHRQAIHTCSCVRSRHESQQQPIANQEGGGDPSPALRLHINEQESGTHPSQTDTSQDTGVALRREIEIQQAIIDNTQQYQGQAPTNDLAQDRSLILATQPLLLQREGKRDTRDKEEGREDHILHVAPIPVHMMGLLGDRLKKGGWKQGSQSHQERATAHDKEHVEASKGIQRLQPHRLLLYFLHEIEILLGYIFIDSQMYTKYPYTSYSILVIVTSSNSSR